MIFSKVRPILSLFLTAALLSTIQGCAPDTAAVATEDSDDDDDDDDDGKDKKASLSEKDKDSESATKKTETKTEKPDTTVVRRQMTNVSDKITRAQANLQRTESLRNSAVERRNQTRSELAQIELQKNDQNSGGFGNNPIKKTKAELQQLVASQTVDVEKFDAQVKALEDEIAQLEAEIEALTLKLEKK